MHFLEQFFLAKTAARIHPHASPAVDFIWLPFLPMLCTSVLFFGGPIGFPDRDAAELRPAHEARHRHRAVQLYHRADSVGRACRATTGGLTTHQHNFSCFVENLCFRRCLFYFCRFFLLLLNILDAFLTFSTLFVYAGYDVCYTRWRYTVFWRCTLNPKPSE